MSNDEQLSLQRQVEAVLTRFRSELKTFMQHIRTANPSDGESQADLLSKLDPVFAVDKELQDAFRKELSNRKKEISALIDQAFAAIVSAKAKVKEEQAKLEMLQHIETDGFDMPTILALAERVSLTVGPPEGWQQDQPLVLHRPPYPTEDLMRSSRLFQVINVGVVEDVSRDAPTTKDGARRQSRVAQDHDMDLSLLELDLNPDLL
ncbi:hypothetical protein PSACC_02102 [Paramicrosporidium saccamoebae]|uniref:Mediator of RNA polymerase II transcription subunit 4 n=1 Tax=Paramicrosporidium saccamoebae TaxID=1246581 RepID=A0A2H9TK18_9FUNG|nr:hypothetical protein PSACC_02102 [Paramicrosporidium saccamoebae]